MWSNGAVVVVKYGDKRIADPIEQGVLTAKIGKHQKKPEFWDDAKAQKKLYVHKTNQKIMEARLKYAYDKRSTSKTLERLEIGYAIIVYGISRAWRGITYLAKETISLVRN